MVLVFKNNDNLYLNLSCCVVFLGFKNPRVACRLRLICLTFAPSLLLRTTNALGKIVYLHLEPFWCVLIVLLFLVFLHSMTPCCTWIEIFSICIHAVRNHYRMFSEFCECVCSDFWIRAHNGSMFYFHRKSSWCVPFYCS